MQIGIGVEGIGIGEKPEKKFSGYCVLRLFNSTWETDY